MTIRIVKLRAEHLTALSLQRAQAHFAAYLEQEGYAASLVAQPHAYAALAGDRVLACAGAIEIWPGRALLWSLIDRESGPWFAPMVRAARGFLAQAPWRRIEAAALTGFPEAARLLRLLGFQYEGTMRAYSPDGLDHDLYARVQ